MPTATIELTDLEIGADIGTYGPDDVVPDRHILDLTLTVDSKRVLIPEDGMEYVFDYDPLIAEIDSIARDGHYHTQERIITRVLHACARYDEIQSVDIRLSKGPVLGKTGLLGVRATVNMAELQAIRAGGA